MNIERKIAPLAIRLKKGGAPVVLIEDLSDEEFLAVYYLRCWFEDTEGKKRIERELNINLGYDQGYKILNSLESLFQLLFRKARRTIVRHNIDCSCVGADESCFSQLITRAANKEREDAMLIAMLLADKHFASKITDLAEEFGLGIKTLLSKNTETSNQGSFDKKKFH